VHQVGNQYRVNSRCTVRKTLSYCCQCRRDFMFEYRERKGDIIKW